MADVDIKYGGTVNIPWKITTTSVAGKRVSFAIAERYSDAPLLVKTSASAAELEVTVAGADGVTDAQGVVHVLPADFGSGKLGARSYVYTLWIDGGGVETPVARGTLTVTPTVRRTA